MSGGFAISRLGTPLDPQAPPPRVSCVEEQQGAVSEPIDQDADGPRAPRSARPRFLKSVQGRQAGPVRGNRIWLYSTVLARRPPNGGETFPLFTAVPNIQP